MQLSDKNKQKIIDFVFELKRIRQNKKTYQKPIRQCDLADELGVERRTIVNMEKGPPSLQIGDLYRISQILDCEIEMNIKEKGN